MSNPALASSVLVQRPARWRTYVSAGIACVAAILALLFIIRQYREALAPHGPVTAMPQKSVVRHPVGPPMQIDPAELARAGQQRDENGLKMKFCWCPPGTFQIGSVPARSGQSRDGGPVSVTIRGVLSQVNRVGTRSGPTRGGMGIPAPDRGAVGVRLPRGHDDRHRVWRSAEQHAGQL
jgi:hypothetical protein